MEDQTSDEFLSLPNLKVTLPSKNDERTRSICYTKGATSARLWQTAQTIRMSFFKVCILLFLKAMLTTRIAIDNVHASESILCGFLRIWHNRGTWPSVRYVDYLCKQVDLCTSETTYGYNAEDIGLLYFAYSIFTPLLVFLTGQIRSRYNNRLSIP